MILCLAMSVLAGCMNHYYKTQGDMVGIFLKKNAQEVYFASSLDQFTPHPAQKRKDGIWKIEVSGSKSVSVFLSG